MSLTDAQIKSAIVKLEQATYINRYGSVISLPYENKQRIDLLTRKLSSTISTLNIEQLQQLLVGVSKDDATKLINDILNRGSTIVDSNGKPIKGTETVIKTLQYLYNNIQSGHIQISDHVDVFESEDNLIIDNSMTSK